MDITSYIELTPAQEETLRAFGKVTVRTALLKPLAVATFRTFQAQEVKVTVDAAGIIQKVSVEG